jgi:hypothetical protein
MITAIVFGLVGSIFGALGFAAAAWACVQVEAMKRSTHQVTFIDPSKQKFESLDDLTKEKLTTAYDREYDNI